MELIIGFLRLAALPAVAVTALLLWALIKGNRSRMWLVATLLLIGGTGWVTWRFIQAAERDLPLPVDLVVMALPLLTVPGVLHLSDARRWPRTWAGVLAACAGIAVFALSALWAYTQV